jgi:general secretion pathway protein E/type IV pilus assembly protein PilB
VASTVEGVMAQRLVRTICPDCKTPFTADILELPMDFPLPNGKDGPPPTLYKGVGCRACRQSGFRGRTGIHELMVTGEQMRELVSQRVNAGVIRHEAMKAGMITLRQDGWRKVTLGQTAVDEVARVTAGDLG